VKDFPGYSRARGAGGPRTKKQLRRWRSRFDRVNKEAASVERRLELLDEERRKPTLHDIDWKP